MDTPYVGPVRDFSPMQVGPTPLGKTPIPDVSVRNRGPWDRPQDGPANTWAVRTDVPLLPLRFLSRRCAFTDIGVGCEIPVSARRLSRTHHPVALLPDACDRGSVTELLSAW